MEKDFEEKIKVRYKETDQMGVVHHSNYIVYLEQARGNYIASLGYPYSRMEKDGILLTIVDVSCKYHSPAYYEDELSVSVHVTDLTPVRVKFTYEVRRGDTLIAEAVTVLACIDKIRRPMRIPEKIESIFKQQLKTTVQ